MTFAALRQALHDPALYPDPTTTVEVRETHISVVFLTDHYAYKIKKPLDLGFLDYSTLARRHFACHQELLLNRRLSTDVYLDVVPVCQDGRHYTLAATGPVVEYALKMRRLSDECTLAALLSRDAVPPHSLVALAQRLGTFHHTHPVPGPRRRFGTLEQVRADWQENFHQTAESVGDALSSATYAQIQQAVATFTTRHAAWFAQRVQDDRIRDCHGDLRAEHIYFEPDGQLQIIDCIEFNTRFRFIDVASEVAFLAMDLERLGTPALAHAFVQAYVQHASDVALYRLVDFYRCYRAYVRGKVAHIRLHEAPPAAEQSRLMHDAAQYFALAGRYAARCTRPLLLITTGLIGSGKSSVAEGVAAALDLHLVSSDQVRKTRAGLSPDTPQRVEYGTGIYHAAASRQTYETLAGLARTALDEGHSVIVDATFSRQEERQRMATLAQEGGADFFLLECCAPVEVIRARLEARRRTPGVISDGRWDILPQLQRDYEPIENDSMAMHICLDTSQPLAACVQQALAAVQAGRP
jgi:hypothetical protein